jgi:hypothetical protein
LGREFCYYSREYIYILCDSRKKRIYTLFKRKIEKITNKEKKGEIENITKKKV